MMRTTTPIGFALMALAACSSGPAECVAAGGKCVIGPPMNCHGLIGPQDCNPDHNPGGAMCCLPCPDGQSPVDGGPGCK